MQFGIDDDSALFELLNTIDIPSVLNRLERIGFMRITTRPKCHMRRMRENTIEDLFIEHNQEGNLTVQHANDGQMAPYIDVITSWEEWVIFVRLLVLRSSFGKRTPRDIVGDDKYDMGKSENPLLA